MTRTRPDLDPELHALLAAVPLRSTLDLDALAQIRPYSVGAIDAVLAGRAVDR